MGQMCDNVFGGISIMIIATLKNPTNKQKTDDTENINRKLFPLI